MPVDLVQALVVVGGVIASAATLCVVINRRATPQQDEKPHPLPKTRVV